MSLLWPLGLLALIGVPAILLLHMRHTEPLVKRFPAIRFWVAAEPSPAPQTRFRRPPITLPLILQLLAALALGLALARPVLGGAFNVPGVDLRTEPRHLVLLLDGSSSMAAAGESGGTRWDEAKAEAASRLDDLSEGDAATVLTLGTQMRSFGASDGPTLARLREQVAAMPLPGGRTDLDAAFALAADLSVEGSDNEIVLLTDGAVAADPASVAALGAPVELRIAPGGGANAAIVSIAARPSAAAADVPSLYARIVNFGPDAISAPAVLLADGFEAGRQQVDIPPDGGAIELGWALPPGALSATVRLDHVDALPADNEATLPLPGSEGDLGLRILLITDSASPLERVLAAIPGVSLTVEQGDRLESGEALGRFDLVALENVAASEEALARLDAPLLIVGPQPGGALPVTGVLPSPTISRLQAGDPLLAGVDLTGVVFSEAALLEPRPGQQEIAGSADGPLALRMDLAGHDAIVFAFDLAGSNLPRRIAFPILIANAVNDLAPVAPPTGVALGDALRFEPRAGAAMVQITPPGGEPVEIPVERGKNGAQPVVYTATGLPGSYRLVEQDASGVTTGEMRVVVNAGHPRESDLRPNAGLAETLAAASIAENGSASGPSSILSHLWPLLALLAIGALAVEWIASLWPRRLAAGGSR
jgi:hypothetical protein